MNNIICKIKYSILIIGFATFAHGMECFDEKIESSNTSISQIEKSIHVKSKIFNSQLLNLAPELQKEIFLFVPNEGLQLHPLIRNKILDTIEYAIKSRIPRENRSDESEFNPDIKFSIFVLNFPGRITSLDLSFSCITSISLELIGNLSNQKFKYLHTLILDDCGELSCGKSEALNNIHSLPKLNYLSLSAWLCINEGSLQHLSGFTKLEELNLQECGYFPYSVKQGLRELFPTMKIRST